MADCRSQTLLCGGPTMFLNKEYETRILHQTNSSPLANSSCRNGLNSPGGDRFIPLRKDNNWESYFLTHTDSNANDTVVDMVPDESKDKKDAAAYKCVLKNELLGMNYETVQKDENEQEPRNMFEYSSSVRAPILPSSGSPLSLKSQQLLKSPIKASRKIPTTSFKVLDAPGLEDDFYLNLVDWSSENILVVGLQNTVYLWEATTSQVVKLCEFGEENIITSVAWSEKGNNLAIGSKFGCVELWDVATKKCVTRVWGHSSRVGSLAWNGDILASGSRDKTILIKDWRSSSFDPERKLLGHTDEVCGLKWSPDNKNLASGGNDNRLHVWNLHSLSPIQTYNQHIAAVRAIAWSPLHRGLLVSGGGTQDGHIRFWNTLTGKMIQSVNSGSQVCNLLWSKHSEEFVSTHGFSHNEIVVWKYPSLTQIAKLTGHYNRVLYLAMAPNGEDIVTGAGREGVLRFWSVFLKARTKKASKSALQLFTSIR